MCDEELRRTLALTRLPGLGLRNALLLYRTLGSATAVFEQRGSFGDVLPGITARAEKAFAHTDEALRQADAELAFAEAHRITCLTPSDDAYPLRLGQCDDAPLVLFYRGSASLNGRRVVSVVGTRRCTDYGRQLCEEMMADFARLVPDVLVVSGLAYGIDIAAHRAALDRGLPTVAVLAHGLDRVYPSMHRETALRMLSAGGLLTEFAHGTVPDKGNFVRRNRIVAGLCDACVVVESAAHGGALITAGIAQDYNRDVFAFPGRVGDDASEGCNRLIRTNGAALVCSGADVAQALGWAGTEVGRVEKPELFPDLTDEEQRVAALLRGSDGKTANSLVVELNMPVQKVLALLMEMEMRGIVRTLHGGVYRLAYGL